MNIIGRLVAEHMMVEDYVFTDKIDTHDFPDLDSALFQFAIGPIPEGIFVDVQQFCGDDGVNFDSMGETQSFSNDNCPEGIFGTLLGSLKSSGERYVKFGFNCNGDTVDLLLFGAVIAA